MCQHGFQQCLSQWFRLEHFFFTHVRLEQSITIRVPKKRAVSIYIQPGPGHVLLLLYATRLDAWDHSDPVAKLGLAQCDAIGLEQLCSACKTGSELFCFSDRGAAAGLVLAVFVARVSLEVVHETHCNLDGRNQRHQ